MDLKIILLFLILVEISGLIQFAIAPKEYSYPYLTLLFIGIILVDKIYHRYCSYKSLKKQNSTKGEKLVNLGKKVKSGMLVHTDDCPICMDKMDKICSLSITNCDHVFHNSCLNKWRKRKNSCPMCRTFINLERELPKSRSNTNIFTYNYFKNSLDNLKEVIDEVFDDETALIYNFGDETAYLLDQDNNFATL